MPRRLTRLLAAALVVGLVVLSAGARAAEPARSAAAERADADRELGFQLVLMRGHLAVGRELLKAGRRDMAAEHFAHPRAELYDDIAPVLKQRKVKPFDGRLQALADAASGQASLETVRAELKSAQAAIDSAWNSIAAERRRDPGFVAALASDALYAAAGEYGTAVEDGRFTEVSEYQDAHGFVVAVRELWDGAAVRAKQARPALHDRVAGTLAAFERALPTPLPPAAPVVGADALKRAAGDLAAALPAKG